jgi:hypothetical protein
MPKVYAIVIGAANADFDDVANRSTPALQAAGLSPLYLSNPMSIPARELDECDFEAWVISHGELLEVLNAEDEPYPVPEYAWLLAGLASKSLRAIGELIDKHGLGRQTFDRMADRWDEFEQELKDAASEPDSRAARIAELDLRTLAQEWRERIEEMASSVPNTEGMSWGELAEATDRFLAEPEQVEYVARYVNLCKELGVSPAEPDALERWADEHGGCGEHADGLVGIHWPTKADNTDPPEGWSWVERCDMCELFEDDEAAARALIVKLGLPATEVAWFDRYSHEPVPGNKYVTGASVAINIPETAHPEFRAARGERFQARYRNGYYVVIDTQTGEVVPPDPGNYSLYRDPTGAAPDGYLWDYAAAYAARDLNTTERTEEEPDGASD